MEIAKIYVNGTMAAVSGLKKIPKGITGATITVTFGNDWAGLTKTAVFHGAVTKDVLDIENVITIPAECVEQSGHRLRVGFYGVAGETLVIPTLWADLGTIQDAADPSGDTSTDPALPVWAQLQDQIMETMEALNAKKPARIAEISLLADKWVGGANQYSQVVEVEGATENSQVDITPSVEQLVIFYEKDLTFVTENDGGVVTVYAIGQKPENDYTIQVTITEVAVRSGKIIGVTVGTTLPKPDLMQTDPTKGDYIKGKTEFLNDPRLVGPKGDPFTFDDFTPEQLAALKGVDGKSIFCTTEEKKATVEAAFYIPNIQKGDRVVSVGDLVVSSNGWLYRVTSISGNIATASFMAILAVKGEDGTDGADGKDGVSCTHSWSGTTLTITSASGTTSMNLKGEKGDTGSQGAKGDKGDTGSQGVKGDTGADGKSAYQIAQDHGFVGTEEEWLESLKGEGGEGGSIVVDSELSATSENPVQNKVITEVVNEFGTTFEQTMQAVIPRLNPEVTTADNGNVLAVVSGKVAAVDASPMIAQVAKLVIEDTFVPLTQSEYDALVASGSVDANKYYLIVGDGA